MRLVFVRIPLHLNRIVTAEFCDCVHSKLGQKYDDEEALSLGLLDNLFVRRPH